MIEEKKQTVGEASLALLERPDEKQSVIDTQREMLKTYMDELIKTAKTGEELYGRDSHFYICVQTRRERTMVNVIRNQFYPRQTRPIPQYDLALYWYDPKTEDLRFVWCIPDRETVEHMYANQITVSPDQRQLLSFVVAFKENCLI